MRETPDSQSLPVNIVGSSTFGIDQKISSSKTTNMFITDEWLYNTSGFQKVLALNPTGSGRGIFNSIRGGIIVVVVNQNVYSLDINLNPILIGELATEAGEVFIDENLNSQICIVDGLNMYIYNYNSGPFLTIQAPTANLVPNYVDFHNNQFLIGNGDRTPTGSLWYAFIFATATTIVQATPGDFPLQTKPDYAIAVVAIPGQGSNVLVFGTAVCEVWTQIGGLQNYRRTNTLNIDYGCASISTIAKSDRFICWLAINQTSAPVIMIYSGQGFERISTDGIDNQLSRIQFPAQSTAMMVRSSGNGHLRYQLTFTNPADNLTIFYDFNTKKFFHLTDAFSNFHPARDYIYFNNTKYFISLLNGSLYESGISFTTYNENLISSTIPDPTINYEIPRERIPDTLRAEDSSQFRPNTFVFTIEQGNDPNVSGLSLLGNEDLLITEDSFFPPNVVIYTENGIPIADEDSGAGIGAGDLPIPYCPRIDMSISLDGGFTWSNFVARYLNPIAIRKNILNWDGMGASNSLTIKLKFFGLDKFVCYNGSVQIY